MKWSRRLQDLEQELEAQDFGAGSPRSWSRKLQEVEYFTPGVGAEDSRIWSRELQELE